MIYKYGKLPGPGQYNDAKFGSDTNGGTFSTATPLNFREKAEQKSKILPAPANHNVALSQLIKTFMDSVIT